MSTADHPEHPTATSASTIRTRPDPQDEPVQEDLDAPPRPVERSKTSKSGRHLLGVVAGVVLTPIAFGLLTYGGYRYEQMLGDADVGHDVRGIVALAAGAFLLAVVAAVGAWSPLAPLLGGVIYGLAPAVLFLVLPDRVLDWVVGSPLLPTEIEAGGVRWLFLGAFLAVGATLVGSGFAAATRVAVSARR